MPVAWLVVARSARIAASILLAGIFAFEVVALGPVRGGESDDLNGLKRQFSIVLQRRLFRDFRGRVNRPSKVPTKKPHDSEDRAAFGSEISAA